MRKPGAAPPAVCDDPEGLAESWRRGIAGLDPNRSPVTGIRPGDWPGVHASLLRFVDEWGHAAAEAGWRTCELFGVHVQAGIVRVDSTGALILARSEAVLALDCFTIRFANGNTDTGMTNPDESVPIWAIQR